ncbi:MAG TPA: ribonuclease P protein component 2 [Candidatus Altiarchaeales archaeon]|nr:ribonuclease P protein component 2 [Candidatus Altiarchaeales archaeon]
MPKQLLPTLRERNRYIAFEVISDSDIGREDVVKAIWSSVLRFLGELNASRTSLWVMDWNDEKREGILKVNHKSVDEVKAALALVKEIDGKRVIFHILGISGTVRKTRERYLKAK